MAEIKETPESERKFPERLRQMLGYKYGCQRCEHRFELIETRPNGKLSKTWTVGVLLFGKKFPHSCAVFVVKCPSCNQPTQLVIIGYAEPVNLPAAAEAVPQPPTTPKLAEPRPRKPKPQQAADLAVKLPAEKLTLVMGEPPKGEGSSNG